MDLTHAFARLDQVIPEQMRADNTPGMAVALTDRERLLRVTTYGFADAAARTAVTSDTLFEIGSIGKSFTAIALLQLHEAGRLDLHAPVTDYLPWFAVRSDHAPITVHHLLSHTAGIIGGTDFAPDARAEVWALRETATGGPPGERFHYSNVGYKALGLLLSRVADEPYGETIRSRILDPLGMTATEPAITHETRRRLAAGYAPFYDDRPPRPGHPLVPATWLETDTGDGSIAATPADMSAYVRMLLNRGQGPNGRLLSAAGFALLTQRVITAWGDAFYGYGVVTQEVNGHTYLGHPGGMVGYFAAIQADLDAGLGAVVLVNGPGRPAATARVAVDLLRAAQEGRELPPVPARPDPTRIENANDYVGTFVDRSRADGKVVTLTGDGEHLLLHDDGKRVALERYGDDTFLADHPAYDRFPLRFGRDGDRVVEVTHGPDWYIADGYAGPTTFDYPSAWTAYPGHYRSHNPGQPISASSCARAGSGSSFPSGPTVSTTSKN